MQFKKWLLEVFDKKKDVPLKPGESPIPSGHIRVFHYTKGDPDKIRENGLLISKARGHTYGEPDMIWGSSYIPDLNIHTVVEFHVPFNDPSMSLIRLKNPEEWDRHNHAGFYRDIVPEEIIAIHEPWHQRYHYIKSHPELIEEILEGKFDHLLDLSDYKKAIQQIKKENIK